MQAAPRAVNHRIESIQCLRAFAALLVVVDHALLTYVSGPGASILYSVHDTTRVAEGLGSFGVEVFFLISGFIMTSTMHNRFALPGASVDFLWKRLIRIVPLYWLVTAVSIVVRAREGDTPDLMQVLESLFFIPYADETGAFQPILRRGWTLNYEMFFYGLLALALLQTRARGLLATIVVLLIIVIAAPTVPPASCGNVLCALPWFYGQPIVLYFVGGIFLAVLRRWLAERGHLPRVPLEACVVLALLPIGAYVWLMQMGLGHRAVACSGVICAALATCACTLVDETGKANPVRSLLLLLGDASYSIYLVHGFVVEPMGRLWMHLVGRRAPALFVLTMVAAASIAAIVSYKLIEKPSMESLRRLARRLKPVPA